MNRRSFLSAIAKAAAAFAILPSALTYERHWKKTGELYVCVIDKATPQQLMHEVTIWQITYDLITGKAECNICDPSISPSSAERWG